MKLKENYLNERLGAIQIKYISENKTSGLPNVKRISVPSVRARGQGSPIWSKGKKSVNGRGERWVDLNIKIRVGI